MCRDFVHASEYVIIRGRVAHGLRQVFASRCVHANAEVTDGAIIACLEQTLERFLRIVLLSIGKSWVPEMYGLHGLRDESFVCLLEHYAL